MNNEKLMRLFLPLLFFLFCGISIFAQNQPVSIELRNASLTELFDAIEKQTTYRFSYRNVVVERQKDITVSVKNTSVQSVLDEVLAKKNLEYNIVSSRSIVISEKTNSGVSNDGVKRISGLVTDDNGEPVIGASIIVRGSNEGTITDIDGKFDMEVPAGGAITISYLGYTTQTVNISDKSAYNIVLREDSKALDEVVVVGYGTQKRGNLTSAISSINSKEIVTTTHSSLAQSLQGKIPGLQIRQQSGGPGEFDTNINIRGFGAPLYIIDGIPSGGGSEFQRLDPNDIESISVLKDASAAIYGLNAGNGVILVTTKKGQAGKPRFTYSGTGGVQTYTNTPKMATASQWMEMYNDSRVNVGMEPVITKEEMQKWKDRAPGYESTDWYNMVMKKFASQTQHNFSVRGGGDVVDYYVSLGYFGENGLLKSNDLNYDRYNIRSNLTAKLGKNLTADVMLSGRMDERRSPGEFFWIHSAAFNALPTERPYANDNPDYYALVTNNNPLPMMEEDVVGYIQQKNKAFLTIVSMTYKAPFLKGLEFKGSFSYDTQVKMRKDVAKAYNVYQYDSGTERYNPTLLGKPSKISNAFEDINKNIIQVQATYNNTFADAHNVSATLVYEQMQGFYRYAWLQREYEFYTNDQINQASTNNQSTDGYETEEANLSLVGKFNYNYKGKYLIDFAFRQDGTYRYHENNKWGFFPVVSGGWRISEENFIKDNVSFLSNLKLRASYGKVGENAGSPFQYAFGYTTTGSGGYEMTDGSFSTGISAPGITNPNLTWFTSTITDFGLDLGLFQNKFMFEFDVYQRDREGLLARRNLSLPNTFGADLPEENLNSDRVRGLEFMISYRDKVGDFSYGISANLNYARTMRLYVERGPYKSSWDRWKNGQDNRWKDVVWGYNYIGRFENMEQILHSPLQESGVFGNTRELPGNYIFEDTNGDGLVDGKDMLPSFWGGDPKLHYGLTLDASWKGFDLNALLQGSGKYTVRFSGTFTQVLWNELNTPAYFYDRWHLADPYDPENSEWIPGEWPAVKTSHYNGSTTRESSAFRKDASYLRLKSIELGYSVPTKFLKKINLQTCRFYVNAHNLFTICDPFVKYFDPEKIEGTHSAGMTYHLTKSYNIGVNITF